MKKNLIKKFKFTEKQAVAILDMRLQQLANLERKKIEDELKDIPIPQVKAVDIDSLFSAEAKEVFKAKRFMSDQPNEESETEDEVAVDEQSLEETVHLEHPQQAQAVVQYGDSVEEAKRLADNANKLMAAYDTVKTLAEKASNGIYMNQEEQHRLKSYEDMAEELYDSGFRPQDPSEEDRLSAAGDLLYQARL